jgi:benzoyl-CoA-dihydrodiol lyase
MASTTYDRPPVKLQTHPSQYKHWKLAVDGAIATLTMAVDGQAGEREGYELKLNSYDIGVDVELADAVQRVRFEHPSVRTVVLTGGLDRVFCAGANIVMLRTSAHAFKVNFCKYTNETRLSIEDASRRSGIKFLAALNGTASGGGYELALACDEILLVDDRNSAVSFPEVPLLGVLPGTGGLTRITDKRKIRRDRCDVFSTIAEGIKGKRAVEWNLVDGLLPLSKWKEGVAERAKLLAGKATARADEAVALEAIEPESTPIAGGERLQYRHVSLEMDHGARTAKLAIHAPDACPKTRAEALAQGSSWWILRAMRELDDAVCRMRFNHLDIALVLVRCTGSAATLVATDALLAVDDKGFVGEVQHLVRRVLKRIDLSAKSFYAVADGGTTWTGTFLEILLACDRSFVLVDDDAKVEFGATAANAGLHPMSNELSRLATRFFGTPDSVGAVLAAGDSFDAARADELGLATYAPDAIDWDDELRLAIEERCAFSPDALTGMEANLRFPGPETMETRIFGRLSAWQNWIFQRPNAVGPRGALQCYGTPNRPEFDHLRT